MECFQAVGKYLRRRQPLKIAVRYAMDLRGICFRMWFGMRSWPEDFLFLRDLRIEAMFDGLIYLMGSGASMRGSLIKSLTLELKAGLLGGWGVKELAKWLARRFAFSRSETAVFEFEDRAGIMGEEWVRILVVLHRLGALGASLEMKDWNWAFLVEAIAS